MTTASIGRIIIFKITQLNINESNEPLKSLKPNKWVGPDSVLLPDFGWKRIWGSPVGVYMRSAETYNPATREPGDHAYNLLAIHPN